MNVILIISDTFRRDHLGCYGSEFIHTPNLDKFAERAFVFDNAYIASFPTVPARHDILTGKYSFTYKPWSPLPGDETTFARILNKAGFITSLIVDTPHPFAIGYNYQRDFQAWELIRGQEHDKWKTQPREIELPCAPEKLRNPHGTVVQYLRNVADRKLEADYFAPRTMQAAADWVEQNYREDFFLYVDTFDPHEPWDPPQYYVDLYDPDYDGEEVIYPLYDRCDFLTEAELKHCRALYAGEVTMVDHWVGMLLDRIESLGLMENSVIIFTTDHGFCHGEHGYIGKSVITPEYHQAIPLYPEISAIPLMFYVPGIEMKRSDAIVQLIDLMPTILDFMGVDIPDSCEGYSLKPLIEGEKESIRKIAIASPTISAPDIQVPHPTKRSSITDGEWMLIYGSQVDKVDSPEVTKMVDSMMRRVQTLEKGLIRPELYNLKEDYECANNVLEENRDVAERLHAAYYDFLGEHSVPERHLQFLREI